MPPEEKKSNALTITLVIVGGLLLACGGTCGVGYWWWTTKAVPGLQQAASELGGAFKDSAAVNTLQSEFVSALTAGNTEGAYKLTSKNFQTKHKTAKEFKDYVDKNKELKGPFSGMPQTTQGSNGKPWTVSYLVGTKNVKLSVVKEGEEFKVDDITIE